MNAKKRDKRMKKKNNGRKRKGSRQRTKPPTPSGATDGLIGNEEQDGKQLTKYSERNKIRVLTQLSWTIGSLLTITNYDTMGLF